MVLQFTEDAEDEAGKLVLDDETGKGAFLLLCPSKQVLMPNYALALACADKQTLLDHTVHESTSFPCSVPEVGLNLREPVQGAREVSHLLRVALVLGPERLGPTLHTGGPRPQESWQSLFKFPSRTGIHKRPLIHEKADFDAICF